MLNFLKSSRFWRIILYSFLGVLFLGFLFYLSVYFGAWGHIPKETELQELKQSEATEIYSSDSTLIGKYYIFDRQSVIHEELPQHLIEALIATEDIRFFEHSGIDQRSLMRVLIKTILLQDESAGGGSTITLQLAKNLFGRENHGILSMPINKVQEAIVARRLERLYSKDEILTLYLNTVPFSDNTYGIESAARKFFSTTTRDLSLEQAATLVGSLKATHYYNPRLFPQRATQRRDVVLAQMEKYDFLDANSYQRARDSELEIDYQYFNYHEGVAPYFREQLRGEAKGILDTLFKPDGESYNLYSDGLQIYTTIDYKMQTLSEEAMAEHMSKLQANFEKAYGGRAPWLNESLVEDVVRKSGPYNKLQIAGWSDTEIMDSLSRPKDMELFSWDKKEIRSVSIIDSIQHYMKFLNMGMINIDPNSGAVKSWVGGINFENFKYDHVAQSSRQVGSTFKPIVYAAALEQGIDPCSYYPVREVTYAEDWTPSNSTSLDQDPHLNYSLEAALSRSINTIAVKVLFDAGLQNVIDLARKMGIISPIPQVPAIALGTVEMSVKDLASAYTTFANRGHSSKPYFIDRIVDKNGTVLFQAEPKESPQPAFSQTTRQLMIEMMKTTVNQGTAARLRYTYGLGNDIAGKTGTTQDNKDGWFVGVTPNLVSAVWVGVDDHRIGFPSTALGQGANSALPIYALLMQKMNADSDFNQITNARFPAASQTVQTLLDCETTQRDNFLERLFGGSNEQRSQPEKESQERERKGFFEKLKGIFSKDN